jgi:hypothetical protein
MRTLLLLLVFALQDECAKFNKCHEKESSTKIDCPECKKTKIPDNDKLCSSCANKAKVCRHCGSFAVGKTPPRKQAKNIEEATKAITQESLRKLLSYLASDELEGRCVGHPGHEKTVEHFAKIYKAAGLKPVADSYFQTVDVRNNKARNTVAILEGTDLKDEVVILGGHHDHIGRVGHLKSQQRGGGKGGDDIFNGADDNGSGSTCIVEIARAFGESGLKPRRTILFITFTGEEWGLLGSAGYCKAPLFPIDKTVAMINMDMVGRNSDKPVAIRGTGTEEGGEFERMIDEAVKKTGLRAQPMEGSALKGGDSDHTSFKKVGVPVLFFDAGVHSDWHVVTDHVDKISFDQMEKVARTAMLVAWEMANTDKRYKFVNK